MRLILILFLLTVTNGSGWAQGQIAFANIFGPLGDPRNAPIFDVDCQTPLAGEAYSAQAYVGLTEDSLQPLEPVRMRFNEGIYAGFFDPAAVTVPGVIGEVYFQIRAWEKAAGASYEEAVASGGKHGFSNIVLVEAIPPLAPPGRLIGLESFCLVPEPSTLALLVCSGFLLAGSAIGRARR